MYDKKYTEVSKMFESQYCILMKNISTEAWADVERLQRIQGWHPAKGCYLLPEMGVSRRGLQSYCNLSDDPAELRAEVREMLELGMLFRIGGKIHLTERGFNVLDEQFGIIPRKEVN